MSRVARLSDFIEVLNIKDLFWNNNSDLYPTCVPTGYTKIEKTRPTFLSPYIGTCVLRGEWNHCIFNGKYYFLTKLQVQDIEKDEYKYQLDYDVMINCLNTGADIRGTLIKTNRKDILDGCLQTTVPILADPIRKSAYSKSNAKKKTWQEELEVRGLTTSEEVNDVISRFKEPTITREGYHAFIYWVENNIIGKGTKDKDWLADKTIGRWNHYAHQNPLFILARLPQEVVNNRWKTNVVRHIGKFLQTTKKEDLVITKQNTPADHFNNGGYVLGKKDNTIGSNIVSEVKLTKLDLSGLTDIVPIDNKTKEKSEPNKNVTFDTLPHTSEVPTPIPIYTLLRKPYLPIGNNKSTTGCITPSSDSLLDYCQTGLLDGSNTPQVIETNANTNFYLWYLNKNNLPLVEEFDPNLKKAGCKLSVSTWNTANTWWGFFHTEYKNIAPIGFLIYQIRKLYTEWEDIEYKGTGANTIYIRNGLKLLEIDNKYVKQSDRYWWSQAGDNLLGLWGRDIRLSRLILDLDQFNWLTITPPEKGRDYKWNTQDYWGYKKFYEELGSGAGYPSLANRSNIKWSGGEVINPYSYDDPDTALPKWLPDRDKKLNDISLYQEVQLDHEIKDGDIVTSSLEHGWFNLGEFTQWILPYKISVEEFKRWISQDLSTTIDISDSEFVDQTDDKVTANALAGTAIAATGLALILAPFTGGISVGLFALAAASAATSLGKAIPIDGENKQQMGSIINIYPYSDSNLQVNPELNDGEIVLYLYGGKYKLGIYRRKKISVSLHQSNNLVKKVDGSTNKEVELIMIRPIEGGEVKYQNSPVLPDDLKLKIITYGTGDKETLTPLDKTHYYSETDLKTLPLTFDLVGTNWYLVLHNGLVNFVPKTNEDFKPIEDEGGEIEVKREVSTYAKINQKSWLNFYGQTFQLTTKFNFNDSFKYSVIPLAIESDFADPDVEYKWLTVDENNDNIDVLVTIPRKQTRSAEKVDATQVLMMKERLLQLATNYEQDRYANELLMGDKRLAMARQREDLDWYKKQSIVNMAAKLGGSALGIYGASKGGANSLTLGAAGVGALISTAPDIMNIIRHPTLMKRVDEDERNLLLANTQQLYQRKLNYEHDFKFQTLKLNKIAGSYQKPGVSNRDAQEKYNKQKKLDNVYVEVLLPSTEQQKRIDHIYDVFGCECVSDHFEQTPLTIKNGMEGGLYRFSKIEKGGINTVITDTTIRDIIKQILENGAKFIDCEIEVEPVDNIPIGLTIPTPPKIVFNTDNIKDWSIDKWDTYRLNTPKKDVIETIKKLPNYGLTDEEWTANRDLFTDVNDDSLLDLLNKVMVNREQGESIVITAPVEVDVEKERLNQTITILRSQIVHLQDQIKACTTTGETNKQQLEVEKARLESQLLQANTQITNLQEQIRSNTEECEANKEQLEEEKRAIQLQLTQCQQQHTDLTKEKEGKEGEITHLEKEVTRLTNERSTAQQELDRVKALLSQLTQERESTDSTNTAEVTRLKGEIQKLKQSIQTNKATIRRVNQQLADRQTTLNQRIRDLNQCNSDVRDKTTEINNLKAQLAQKQTQIDRAPSQTVISGLQRQLVEATQQINELQAQCNSEKTQLETTKQQLQEEIRQHKVDKEDLTQQLNDERRRAINEKDEINRLKKQLADNPRDTEDECRLLKTIFSTKYTNKQRELIPELKWSPYKDLLKELALSLNWMRKGQADTHLQKIAHDNNKQALLQFLKGIEQIQNYPDVDKMIDVVSSNHWYILALLISKGTAPSDKGAIKDELDKLRQITDSENSNYPLQFKEDLDSLNYLAYKAWEEIQRDIKVREDKTVQYFFDHVFPGKTMELYKDIYGETWPGLVKRQFVTEDCGGKLETKTVLGYIGSIRTQINSYVNRDKQVAPEGTSVYPPNMPFYILKGNDDQGTKYPLDTHSDIFRPDINKFINKKNNVQTYRGARQTKYGEKLGGYIALQDGYKYTRTSNTNRSRSRQVVWLYTGWIHDVGMRDEPVFTETRKYMCVDTFNNRANKHTVVVDGIRSLLGNIDKIGLNRVTTSTIKTKHLDYIKVNWQNIDLSAVTLEEYTFNIGKDILEGFGDNLTKLLKLFSIFDRNKVKWRGLGKDTTDSYWMYELEFSTDTDLSKYAAVTNPKRDSAGKWYVEFDLGAHISNRWKYDPLRVNNIFLVATSLAIDSLPGNILVNALAYPYVLLCYFYNLIVNPQSYVHPWQWDSGAVYMFFDEMYKIANT